MNKKSTKPPRRLNGGKIEVPETDRLMTIFTKSGNVKFQGPGKVLREFKDRIKDKENRHTFLDAPARLFTFNPALEEVTVLPADVGIIIIADLTKAVPNSRIAVPIHGVPKNIKPN